MSIRIRSRRCRVSAYSTTSYPDVFHSQWIPRYPSMRAINTKFATLSSTTRTVASLGIVGFLIGCVSVTFSGMRSPLDVFLDFPGELIDVDRLLNITVASSLDCFFLVAAHDVGSQSQDRHAFESRHSFDLRGQTISVYIRHIDVH